MTTESLSAEDKEFLAKCEEEFKDRYTEKDEEFMKVHTADQSPPPIIESWWVSQHSGSRRNDRRSNYRSHPYDRHNRDHDRRSYDDQYDRGQGSNYRPRYNY